MSLPKLKFAIFGNIYQTKKSAAIQKVLSLLSERKAQVAIDREFYQFLVEEQRLDVKVGEVFDGDNFQADYVISMGGDGTFLKAASRVGDKCIPIIGVNIGRLGFLADVSPADIEETIEALYRKDFTLESHAMIMLEASDGHLMERPYALNDIAVLKRDNASMISIRANVDGDHLVTYQADGLIVSTPTGSTAYALSNGGPIIAPQAAVISLTPVAPHSLNIRPMVIPDNSVVTLDVESRSHQFLIAIDGRSERCSEGVRLTIRKAPFAVSIVKRHDHRYFSTLREKMMWGADHR